jgi:ABC-type arginine transport system ATPase subunit
MGERAANQERFVVRVSENRQDTAVVLGPEGAGKFQHGNLLQELDFLKKVL